MLLNAWLCTGDFRRAEPFFSQPAANTFGRANPLLPLPLAVIEIIEALVSQLLIAAHHGYQLHPDFVGWL
jgi:hypothetical protein